MLTGPNGAGKTNLLEAISFLAPGRGLRRARLGEIDRRVPPAKPTDRPPGAWAVAARLMAPRGAVQIGTGRDAASHGGERRLVRIEAPIRAKSQMSLAEHAHIAWLTPQMDRLFSEGSGERRRFLDRLVLGFDAGHAARLAAYERAMRERARLLRDGPADPAWLGALETTMAADGIAIAAARRELTPRLDAECAAAPGPFPQARLRLPGEVEAWLATMPALAAEDALRRRLETGRRADGESGTTLCGPHRADLAVHHVANGMAAASCSTGEQKALLIAILLAHARLRTRMSGTPPILLLDEVAAHLDPTRRAALFDALAALEAQAWLTGTEPALFAGLAGRAQFFTVADAAIAF